jgi:hypothetical protein
VKLRRYWFEFRHTIHDPHPVGTLLGCGVTAFSREDALQLLDERVFGRQPLPSIRRRVEDVDVSALDPGHVLPNMADPTWRGVWFPLGYDG